MQGTLHIRYLPERNQGLANTLRPGTGVGLMQFLQAANWVQIFLVNFAAVVRPLREMLEELLAGTKRTRWVAIIRMLQEEDWATKCDVA